MTTVPVTKLFKELRNMAHASKHYGKVRVQNIDEQVYVSIIQGNEKLVDYLNTTLKPKEPYTKIPTLDEVKTHSISLQHALKAAKMSYWSGVSYDNKQTETDHDRSFYNMVQRTARRENVCKILRELSKVSVLPSEASDYDKMIARPEVRRGLETLPESVWLQLIKCDITNAIPTSSELELQFGSYEVAVVESGAETYLPTTTKVGLEDATNRVEQRAKLSILLRAISELGPLPEREEEYDSYVADKAIIDHIRELPESTWLMEQVGGTEITAPTSRQIAQVWVSYKSGAVESMAEYGRYGVHGVIERSDNEVWGSQFFGFKIIDKLSKVKPIPLEEEYWAAYCELPEIVEAAKVITECRWYDVTRGFSIPTLGDINVFYREKTYSAGKSAYEILVDKYTVEAPSNWPFE